MGFWDSLWDDEYESSTEIYSDKDKFVMRTYYNGKKHQNKGIWSQNRITGEATYKNTNPLLNVVGSLIAHQQNKKIKQIER